MNLYEELERLFERVGQLEFRLANLNPVGSIAERDHEKGARIRLGGDDDAPLLSPWIKPSDWAGTTSYLPDVGEQVMMISHGGDWLQATFIPLTHSDEKPNPATGADETVFYKKDKMRFSADKSGKTFVVENDKAKITINADSMKLEVEGASMTLSQNALVLRGVEKIVTDGPTFLGSADASRELALRDSVDTAGDVEAYNLATKVKGV